ncbi:unnamed protein product, partial [Medioppia subpectinata]
AITQICIACCCDAEALAGNDSKALLEHPIFEGGLCRLCYDNIRVTIVLSLMDGISSAKLALEKLGLKIDAYYSSESDANAIEISRNYNKNSVLFVDSIESITLEKIAAMSPIDLVLGSPPPEYSSNASVRKSLIENKGSGHYFLYFNHILHLIRLTNKNRHIFFLCENSNPLSNSQRDIISNLFTCKPITLFANNSSHNRNRYYWSNIPGIKRPLPQTIQEKLISLINILTQNIALKTTSDSNKKSMLTDSEDKNFEPKELEKLFELPENYTDVNSLPCKPITLFANNSSHNRNRYYWSNIPGIKRPLPQTIQEKLISLINILTQNIALKTTSDSNKKSMLTDSEDKNFEPKELEKLFELPENYTDVNSLPVNTRQSLLTRCWCVSILSHLIWSLTDFFVTIDQKSK